MSNNRKFSHEQWTALLEESIATINSLAALKGGEYAGDSDRLANFRRNAEQTGSSMELVWSIYYNKHHDAVMQWVRDRAAGKQRQRAEPLAGRVDDMIVYLLLLKAIIWEGENPEQSEDRWKEVVADQERFCWHLQKEENIATVYYAEARDILQADGWIVVG